MIRASASIIYFVSPGSRPILPHARCEPCRVAPNPRQIIVEAPVAPEPLQIASVAVYQPINHAHIRSRA